MDLIIGPMFSGKSTELLRRIRTHKIAKRNCVLIKPKIDDRYSDNKIVTHDKLERDAIVLEFLADYDPTEIDVIGIDEGQFFPDLVETTRKWSDAGIIVIVAMLNGTFERKLFQNTGEIFALCKNITKLNAVCKFCYSETAIYSKRTNPQSTEILLGGESEYVPLCKDCFLKT